MEVIIRGYPCCNCKYHENKNKKTGLVAFKLLHIALCV